MCGRQGAVSEQFINDSLELEETQFKKLARCNIDCDRFGFIVIFRGQEKDDKIAHIIER